MNKDLFENKIKQLTDEKIRRVTYFELSYEVKKPFWDEFENFDTADFGVEFTLLSGKIFSFTWANEFENYGISLVEGSLGKTLKSFSSWEVTKNSRWINFIDKPINSAEIIWDSVENSFGDENFYPQTLVLDFFGRGKVYLSVCQYSKEEDMADNLVIVFTDEIALRYNLTGAN